MNLFKKLFARVNASSPKNIEDVASKYMPKENVPVDEQFMLLFTEKGGKFLYCDNMDEAHDAFKKILIENNWQKSEVCCFQDSVKADFSNFNLTFSNKNSSKFYLSNCEYLISSIGGILVSSNQLREKKLFEVPDHLVIVAYTSQLIRNISEGLQGIKNKTGVIPSNITTLQHFEKGKQNDDFMTYGSTTKNVYLLLIEDL